MYQGCHSPQIGAEGRPHSKWQKVKDFPNSMLKIPNCFLRFDLNRCLKTSLPKQLKISNFSTRENTEFPRIH